MEIYIRSPILSTTLAVSLFSIACFGFIYGSSVPAEQIIPHHLRIFLIWYVLIGTCLRLLRQLCLLDPAIRKWFGKALVDKRAVLILIIITCCLVPLNEYDRRSAVKCGVPGATCDRQYVTYSGFVGLCIIISISVFMILGKLGWAMKVDTFWIKQDCYCIIALYAYSAFLTTFAIVSEIDSYGRLDFYITLPQPVIVFLPVACKFDLRCHHGVVYPTVTNRCSVLNLLENPAVSPSFEKFVER